VRQDRSDVDQEVAGELQNAFMLPMCIGAVGLATGAWMLVTAPRRTNVALLPSSGLHGVRVLVRF
jgi:hypothetical protein